MGVNVATTQELGELDAAAATTEKYCPGCSLGCHENGDCKAELCKEGWWGRSSNQGEYTCDKRCADKCLLNGVRGHCHKDDGMCEKCYGKWLSPSKKPEDLCSVLPSEGCAHGHYDDGDCVWGPNKDRTDVCKIGYWGKSTHKGFFRCKEECSFNCYDDNIQRNCNAVTGSCTCRSGYWSKPGSTGQGRCREKCNEGCAHGCYNDGDCKGEKLPGGEDEKAETCKRGFWGPARPGHYKCDQTCAPRCYNDNQFKKCNKQDGSCTCFQGWWSPSADARCSAKCKGCAKGCKDNGECKGEPQDDVCKVGWWGISGGHFRCDKECAKDCFNDGVEGKCDRSDGSCVKK